MVFLHRRSSLCRWSEGSFRQGVADTCGKLSASSEHEGVSCGSLSHSLPSHLHVILRLSTLHLHPSTACISTDAAAAPFSLSAPVHSNLLSVTPWLPSVYLQCLCPSPHLHIRHSTASTTAGLDGLHSASLRAWPSHQTQVVWHA